MTKTAKTVAAETSETYFSSIQNAIDTVQSKLEVPAAARDFVKRGASTAKERAESVHAGAAKLTNGVEKFATGFVSGYANFARGLLDMTLANAQHAFSTVEKVAGAQSINEAVQIQADFVRESASANLERVRDAAETAKSVVVDGAKTVQAELSKLYGSDKKAA